MAGNLELDAQTYADWGVDYLKASPLLFASSTTESSQVQVCLIPDGHKIL